MHSAATSFVTSTESVPSNRQLVSENPLRRPLDQQATLLESAPVEAGTHLIAKCQCNYWCTVCEPPRPYETSGGWIKHEKEHHEKTVYVCMPDGPTSNTEHGLICVLCGAINPDATHLEDHNISPCLSRAVTARTYTRHYQLQKHLETHNVQKDSSVARNWRRVCNKQAWACGFCVAYFAKAKERFYHIGTQHYERGEDISNWDPSKVILGLLQQPKVHKAWTKRLKSEFPAGEIDLRWDKTPSRSLITMLELGVRGTEDGADLATAAFIQSDYYQSRSDSRHTAITPIEGTERRMRISQRGMQDLHQLDHSFHNSEPNQTMTSNRVNPTMDNSQRPGWPHPSRNPLPQATDIATAREVLAEFRTLDPNQTIHSDWSKSDVFGSSSFEIQSISHPEQPTWPDPIFFGIDYASHYGLKNTSSSLSYLAPPLFGECVGSQPIRAPIGDREAEQKPRQESLRMHSKESISPSSPNKRLVSKFSTHRSTSPMDVDLDVESSGVVLGNEETILETQINLWDQNMYLR